MHCGSVVGKTGEDGMGRYTQLGFRTEMVPNSAMPTLTPVLKLSLPLNLLILLESKLETPTKRVRRGKTRI